jgi:hypothetical protein
MMNKLSTESLKRDYEKRKKEDVINSIYTWECGFCARKVKGTNQKPAKLCVHNNNVKMTRKGA